MTATSTFDMIGKKVTGEELSVEEIQQFVDRVVQNEIHQSQIGAMLMAMYLRGLNARETADLTGAMTRSGQVLSWPSDWRTVDKHSTGGVGDKVSLPLAPCLAACGLKVPMISGRGLGHTGGTLDKLESIPGFTVNQSYEEMKKCLEEVGCCIVGQTEGIVPADKHLYAIRDMTHTVDSVPLITASVISKKAAEGIESLVLDVKYGIGAFMKTKHEAKLMAKSLVRAATGLGIQSKALITNMDHPVGFTVGNANEVFESIQCLRGQGPDDLNELVRHLGSELLQMTLKIDNTEAVKMIEDSLADGSGLEKFEMMLKAQGVSESTASELCRGDPWKVLPPAENVQQVRAKSQGYVSEIDAMVVAEISASLGAARKVAGAPIDHAVGITLCVSPGDSVDTEQVVAKIHYNGVLDELCVTRLQTAITIQGEPCQTPCRILEVISPEDPQHFN